MISKFEDITEMLNELEPTLNQKIHLFMIGGGAMLHYKLKSATKDIDLVTENQRDYTEFGQVLRHAGFVPKIPTLEYSRMRLSQILVRGEFRIDLFHRTVCNGFSLSKNMKQRAETVYSKGNIALSLCSKEDIFLFKTLTERDWDLIDCVALTERNLNWNTILAELKNQIKDSNKHVWITWVGETLDKIRERGIKIPIIKEIDELRDAYFEENSRKQLKE